MISIIELHNEHQEWLSEINFLIREIDFFHSVAYKYEKEINDISFIESVEAYMSTFDVISDKLRKHKVAIEFSEVKLREAIQEKSVDPEFSTMVDPIHQRTHIKDLIVEVRLLKESLFDLVLTTKKQQTQSLEY